MSDEKLRAILVEELLRCDQKISADLVRAGTSYLAVAVLAAMRRAVEESRH